MEEERQTRNMEETGLGGYGVDMEDVEESIDGNMEEDME